MPDANPWDLPHTPAQVVADYIVDVPRRCVRVRLSGALTGAALSSTFIDARNDPRITSEFRAVIDLREVQSTETLRPDGVRIIAATHSNLTARAFVATDAAVFGMCRMLATYRELADRPETVGVFRSVRAAEDWLDVAR
jgi:hypothetical protein